MVTATSNPTQNSFKIDESLNTQAAVNKKEGVLRNHKVSMVILGAATALAGIAAIVAAVFAAYLLAAVCASAFILFAVSSFVVSRIRISQEDSTTKPLEKKIAEVKKNTQLVAKAPVQELKKQVERPNQGKAKENKEPVQNLIKEDVLLKNELLQKEAALEKQKEEIEKLRKALAEPRNPEIAKKPVEEHQGQESIKKPSEQGLQASEEIASLKEENQRLKKELEQHKEEHQLKQKEAADKQQLELQELLNIAESEDGHQSEEENLPAQKEGPAITQESLKEQTEEKGKSSGFGTLLKSFMKPKKKDETKNPVNKYEPYIDDLNKIKDVELAGRYIKSKRRIEKLESKEIKIVDKIVLTTSPENEKIIKRAFLELVQTELSFCTKIEKLRAFYDFIIKDKLFKGDDYKDIISEFDILITESKALYEALNKVQVEALKKVQSKESVEELIKGYCEVYSPKRIKKYLEPYIKAVPRANDLKESLKKASLRAEGKKISARLSSLLGDTADIESSFLEIIQRMPRHKMLMIEFLKLIVTSDNLKNMLDPNKHNVTFDNDLNNILYHNLSYIKAFGDLINVFSPTIPGQEPINAQQKGPNPPRK